MSGEEKDRFKERGITFQMAKMGDLLRIWNFMVESFLPDEPTSRSALGSAAPGSMGYKMFRYVAKEEIKKGLRCDTSLLALDTDNEIVGIKIGYVREMTDRREHYPSCLSCMPKLASILPKKAVQIYGLIDVVFNKLRYDPHLAMEDLGCISIYVGDVLAVSPKARGLGLAGELVKRSIQIAREHKCEYYFACVTGIYSQRIFAKLGFQVMNKMTYAEGFDLKGNLIVNQPGEHTHAETVSLKLDSVTKKNHHKST